MSKRSGISILLGFAVLAAATVFSLPRIPQNPAFNHYADQRSWFGIPYTLDVLSNIPFVVAGVVGLTRLRRLHRKGRQLHPAINVSLGTCVILFVGITLTGFGSAYYHWHPSNDTLLWDRLPMTVVFTAFFASMIIERINQRVGRQLLGPLLAVGIDSVLFWHWGESRGVGDLRLYGLVQFFPMAAIPVMSPLFPPRYTGNRDLWIIFGWYALAIVFQLADAPVYSMIRFVSGHTLKHVCASIAAWQIVQMLTRGACGST